MSSLFKLSLCAVISSVILTGCNSHPLNASKYPVAKTIDIHAVSADGVGEKIGNIHFADSASGLVINTHLKNLPAGERGFHIHENPSCAPADKDGKMGAALAAGSHLNTNGASNHGTPLTGHLGDLPALKVAADGTANVRVIAPRLKVADITNRSVMVHAGGDNYSDLPKALGGGGERIACGVIR
mgnify:CR=1 FL=1